MSVYVHVCISVVCVCLCIRVDMCEKRAEVDTRNLQSLLLIMELTGLGRLASEPWGSSASASECWHYMLPEERASVRSCPGRVNDMMALGAVHLTQCAG